MKMFVQAYRKRRSFIYYLNLISIRHKKPRQTNTNIEKTPIIGHVLEARYIMETAIKEMMLIAVMIAKTSIIGAKR